jgi:hypothetical protein
MLSLLVLRMNVRFNRCRYRDLKIELPYATVEAFKVIWERYIFVLFFIFGSADFYVLPTCRCIPPLPLLW